MSSRLSLRQRAQGEIWLLHLHQLQRILQQLGTPSAHDLCSVDPRLSAAIALWQNWRQDPEACLRIASHGQRLIGLGDHDADFRCCAGLDQISVVPTQIEPGVLKAA